MSEYYYPYCGFNKGWCLSKVGCGIYNANDVCEHFTFRHPVTGFPVTMMNEDTKNWLKDMVKGDNGESKRKT